jgi:hypothetical protein
MKIRVVSISWTYTVTKDSIAEFIQELDGALRRRMGDTVVVEIKERVTKREKGANE